MKKNVFLPYAFFVSILLGFASLVLSSSYLFNNTISKKEVVLQKTDDLSVFEKFKVLKSESSNTIDSIFYSSAYSKLNDTSAIRDNFQFLKNINNEAFVNQNPLVFRWITFHTLALGLSMASGVFIFLLVFKLFQDYKSFFDKKVWTYLIASLLTFLIFLVCIMYPYKSIITGVEIMQNFGLVFKDPAMSTRIIIIPLFLVSLIPSIGILLIHISTYSLFSRKEDGKTSKEDLQKEYLRLKDNLNVFAFFNGLLVSVSVIGTGLQRNMLLNNQISNLDGLFPIESVYAYGLAFSFILAVFYVPAFIYLKFFGKEFPKEIEEKKGKFWSLGESTIENLKIVFSILLPTFSSFVQSYFN